MGSFYRGLTSQIDVLKLGLSRDFPLHRRRKPIRKDHILVLRTELDFRQHQITITELVDLPRPTIDVHRKPSLPKAMPPGERPHRFEHRLRGLLLELRARHALAGLHRAIVAHVAMTVAATRRHATDAL